MSQALELHGQIMSGMYRQGEELYDAECHMDLLKIAGAVWIHPDINEPRVPHVVLRSGLHSGMFMDLMQFFCQGYMLAFAADQLRMKIQIESQQLPKWMIGSPMAGLGIAAAVAMMTGCKFGFTEKEGATDRLACRFDQLGSDDFMAVEDMTTTGQTPCRSINAVLEKNPKAQAAPIVGAYLIRCADQPKALEGRRLISLASAESLDLDNKAWEPHKCPYCQNGSKVLKNVKRCWPAMMAAMLDPTTAMPAYAEYVE